MSSASHHAEEAGILLRSRPSGESDKLLSILGETRGLFLVTAKGARKSRRRFMGRLEPFTIGSFQTSRYRGRDYLDAVEPRLLGDRISADLGRYYLACYACEAALVHLEREHPAPEAYRLLSGLLEEMITARVFDDQVGRAVFELGYLELHGLLPEFGPCSECGAGVGDGGMGFDALRAEWSCGRHQVAEEATGVHLGNGDWELLERLRERGFPLSSEPVEDRDALRRVNRFAALLFRHQLPGRLRSASLLNTHQRNALHPKSPTS